MGQSQTARVCEKCAYVGVYHLGHAMPCYAGAMVNQFLSRVSWDLGSQEAEGWGQQVPKFFKMPLHKLGDDFRHM